MAITANEAEKRCYTVKEIQEILGISRPTVYELLKKNEFRWIQIGASGDTELFEKASNINGFQGGRVANNLYISPFRATVFQTAALFLYPNSSAVIGVENLRFLSLWLAF